MRLAQRHKHSTKKTSSGIFRAVLWNAFFIIIFIKSAQADTPMGNISDKAAADKKSKTYFVRSNAPPPGFENIDPNTPQTTLVSVYYGKKLITNTLATFTSNDITFKNPNEIIQAFNGLKNPAALQDALSKTLPAHQENLCSNQRTAVCKTIAPPVVGVVFDSNSYRAYLFFNPDFVEASQIKPATLPHSTAGFSAMSNNSVILTRNLYDTYAINTRTLMGEGDGYVTTNAYYTHQDLPGAADLLTVPEMAGSLYNNENRYSVGVLPTSGSGLFIQTITMIGAKFQNQQEPGGQSLSTQGTPVIIYLPLPSQVQVYRNNELIFSDDFGSGKQQLDTSGFPVGSYDITVKITDALQQTREEHQFFVKRTTKIDPNDSRYSLSAGVIEKNDQSIDRNSQLNMQLPEWSSTDLLGFDRSQLLSTSLEWDEHIASDVQRSFVDSELLYFGEGYEFGPGVLFSTDGQYGIGSTAIYQYRKLYLNLTASRLYGTQHVLDNTSNNSFMPVTLTKYLVSASSQLAIKQERFSLFGSWENGESTGYSQTSSFTWTHPLIQSKSTSTDLILDLSHTTNNSQISLGIQFDFSTQYFDGHSLFNYSKNQLNSDSTNGTDIGFARQLSLRKSYRFSAAQRFNWAINENSNSYSENYGGKADYISLPLRARASYLHTLLRSDSDNSDLYSVQLDSTLAYSDGRLGAGYPDNKNAGIIAEVSSPSPGETQVLANNRVIGTVSNNSPSPIFLAPYQTYNITINPQGGGAQYSYDTKPQSVTLYEGNLQHVSWTLEPRVILFAEIVDLQGHALPRLLLEEKNKYDMTDDSGYLQAEIPEKLHTLTFVNQDGLRCNIALPQPLKSENGLAVLDHSLVCDLKKKPS